jgi:hypothetical protein
MFKKGDLTKAEMKEWNEWHRFAGKQFPNSDNDIPHADTGLTDAEQILSDLLYPPYLVADPFSSDSVASGDRVLSKTEIEQRNKQYDKWWSKLEMIDKSQLFHICEHILKSTNIQIATSTGISFNELEE